MKKRAPYIIAMGLAVLALTGCQGNDSAKETQAGSVQTEAVTEAKTEAAKAEGTEGSKTEDAEAGSENAGSDAGSGAAEKNSVYEEGGWKVTYEDVMSDTKLENVSTQLGYTDVSTSEYHKEASEGKKFCMIKLIFEKVDSKEEIDFTKLKLVDENGNEYNRMDDTFISDLGMKRLQGTKLNFGTNEGWICYEVDESATQLTLEYPFEAGNLSVQVL
ncbi:DUF4352 domain-containing protein [uncultured Robinsoniella sp.]|uniref:DUF4352 domain-containing protein n=1 Tax=uncultured Robinsoniella sp. TaxID=904190 RepID=UPI00374F4E40